MCPVSPLEPPVPSPPTSWPAVLPRMEASRAALAHQLDLETTLAGLLNDIKAGSHSQVRLAEAVIAAQTHTAGLKEFLHRYVPRQVYNERRSDTCTAAQRTFDVVELLEMILNHLSIPDVVTMCQVSRSLKASIESSTKMQDKLSLRAAAPDTKIYSPFESCLFHVGGFRCTLAELSNVRPSEKDQNMFAMRAYFFPFLGQNLPKIGSKYRSMFICQPPISEMKVYLSCCPRDREWGFLPQVEVSTISCEQGLTIGHLYDSAEKLMAEHRMCPYASTRIMDDDGVVQSGVQFKEIVRLQPNHPIIRDYTADMEVWKKEDERYRAKEAKFSAYRAAKIQAHNSDDPLPSLQEFELANAGADWVARAYETPGSYCYLGQDFGTFPDFSPIPPPPPPPPDALLGVPDALEDFDFGAFLGQN